MYCKIHKQSELMLKDGGLEERDNKIYLVQILYCPHCKDRQQQYKRLVRNGEEPIIEAL